MHINHMDMWNALFYIIKTPSFLKHYFQLFRFRLIHFDEYFTIHKININVLISQMYLSIYKKKKIYFSAVVSTSITQHCEAI